MSKPALALLALACVAAIGCGGSESGGEDAQNQSGAGSEEAQVRRAVEGLYADLADYDAEGVCERMSPTARRQIAQGAVGGRSARAGTCAQAFGRFLNLAKRNGGLQRTLEAKVGDVKVDGRTARVTVSFGPQSGQIPLRKIAGEWMIGVALATPSSPPRP